MKVVIIGNGIAGNQVAFMLRQEGHEGEICIISAESVPEYDPCSLPYFLGGDVERKSVFRKTIQDYEDHNIELVFNSRVVSIDSAAKLVITEKGQKTESVNKETVKKFVVKKDKEQRLEKQSEANESSRIKILGS